MVLLVFGGESRNEKTVIPFVVCMYEFFAVEVTLTTLLGGCNWQPPSTSSHGDRWNTLIVPALNGARHRNAGLNAVSLCLFSESRVSLFLLFLLPHKEVHWSG